MVLNLLNFIVTEKNHNTTVVIFKTVYFDVVKDFKKTGKFI